MSRRRKPRASPTPVIPTILAHPFELGIATVFLIAGIRFLQVALTQPQLAAAGNLLTLPLPVILLWSVSIVLGGTGIITSVFMPETRELGLKQALERAALYLAASAWGTLAIVTACLNFANISGWLQMFALTTCCVLRLVAMARIERGLRRVGGE